MGTCGRVSVRGPIIGNTAEDVLSNMQAAVLVVTPSVFASPVSQ